MPPKKGVARNPSAKRRKPTNGENDKYVHPIPLAGDKQHFSPLHPSPADPPPSYAPQPLSSSAPTPDEELYTLVSQDLYDPPIDADCKIIMRTGNLDDRFYMSGYMYAKGPILDAKIMKIVGKGQWFSLANYVPPVIWVQLRDTTGREPLANRPDNTTLSPNFYFVKDIRQRFTKQELERMKTEAEELNQKQSAANFARLEKYEKERAAAAWTKQELARVAWEQKKTQWKNEDDAREAGVTTTAIDPSHPSEQSRPPPTEGGRKSRRSKSNKNKRTRRKSAKRQYRRRK